MSEEDVQIKTELVLEKLDSLPDDLKDKLDTRIETDWDQLVEALMQLAKGIWREEVKVDGRGVRTERIYQDKPDKEVAQYLVNRILGKPRETGSLQGRVNFIMDE